MHPPLPLPSDDPRGRWWIRPLLAVVVLGGLVVAARLTGLDGYLEPERARQAVIEAGSLGYLLFAALFAIGQLVYVPGWAFYGIAVYVWGPYAGAVVAYLCALASVVVSFGVVRFVGGQPLGKAQGPRMKKLLGALERYPLRTVVISRTLFFLSPPLNYALALTSVSTRDYVLGSAVGLLVPTGVVVFILSVVL